MRFFHDGPRPPPSPRLLPSLGPRLSLLLLLPISRPVEARSSRDDGIHRVEKQTLTTQPARLHARDAGNVCGAGLKACPSSLGGKCCPDGYECARESCYATTRGPSTCGSKAGWYACGAVYGGGCCPDGYLCQRAANCVPPSGSAYTYGCPASQYLCPASMSYGCCSSGMACGVGQCYSATAPPATTTRTLTLTAVRDGRTTELTTTATATAPPRAPTGFPTADPDLAAAADHRVLKYYPTAVAQVSPPDAFDRGGGGGGGGGISAAQLAGLVAGSTSLVALALIATLVLLRRLKHSDGSSSGRGAEGKAASSSDTDGAEAPRGSCSELTAHSPGGSCVDGAARVSPAATPSSEHHHHHHLHHDAAGAAPSCPCGGDGHARRPSDVSEASSDASRGRAELEARPFAAELSSGWPASAADAGRDGAASGPAAHPHTWTGGWAAAHRLDVVEEEAVESP